MRISLAILLILLVAGCTPPNLPLPPNTTVSVIERADQNPKIQRAWANVVSRYPQAAEMDLVIEYDPEPDPKNRMARTQWGGHTILVDRSWIALLSECSIEITLFHEFWHAWDMQVNHMSYSDMELMESRAYAADEAYEKAYCEVKE